MSKQKLIDVYELPEVSNICNQVLREVISLSKVSLAHVTIAAGNISLWHQHSRMTEIYFILKGEGILYYGNQALQAETGLYLVLPPNTPHRLKNTGGHDLEHLVFAIPPFNLDDVKLLEDVSMEEIVPKRFNYDQPLITASDGALIRELMNVEERKSLNVALAIGFLSTKRRAIPHYHQISEEIYYILGGNGLAKVGEQTFEVKKDSVIYVPANYIHALENKSDSEELCVLCLSSPAYTEGDFLKVSRN